MQALLWKSKKGLGFSCILIFLPNLSPGNSVSHSRAMPSVCEGQGGERFSCQVERENFCLQQVHTHLDIHGEPAEISIFNSLSCLQRKICLSVVWAFLECLTCSNLSEKRGQKGDDDSDS